MREKEGGKETSVTFPWFLAVHHQSLAFRARLYHARNETPEEEAAREGLIFGDGGGGGGVISGGFASGGAYYRQFTVNRRSRLCDAGLGHNLRVYKLLLPLKVSSLLGTNNAGVTDFIQIVMSLHKSVAAQSPEKSDFSVSDPGGSEEKELTEKFSLSCSHQAKIISTSAHKHISTFCSPSSMQNVCHMTLAPISLLYLS